MTRMNNNNMLFHKPPDLSQLCSLLAVIYGPNSSSHLIRIHQNVFLVIFIIFIALMQ